ncbi:helix-turn-helix domain-containing protein [Actinomadura verrucosospora]|uniref:XRE family transcriptional regulator n=1 Tax=Actinomadura verrucosospora TaxID=46165 RepID=A0A7D3VX08_ACTVE|nr:helix-turn-helix transcriptional regulator [Actinomadura verrucosospora]QKG25333.1 XRE family transcriptional regulator [Actinomadura verrucosospora]
MASRRPTPQTIAFGIELTSRREDAGLSRLDLANRIPVTRSYIGQIETGTTRCRREFAAELDTALDSGTAMVDAWDDLLKTSRYPTWFADYPLAEGTASLLRAYETMFVYGLFQTEAYIRALLLEEAAIEGRLRRQAVLQRENPPMLRIVLAENVLWTPVGGPETMREQCEHLLTMSACPNVTLQIAPFGFYRGMNGSFNLATQPDGGELLHMTTTRAGVTSTDREDILHVVSAFSALQANALSAADSREFLRKAVIKWT